MKSMLIIASFIALAVASPMHRGLVTPGMPGPAPVIEESPIAVGPAIIDDFVPVNPVDVLPVNPVIDIPGPDGTPLVQIILNINTPSAEAVAPSPAETPVVPEVVIPGPVNVVDSVEAPIVPEPVVIGNPVLPEVVIPGPVNVVDNVEAPVVPEPVVIGTPSLPEVVIPEPIVIGTPTLPEIVVPEPVIIGTPIVPAPAVVLPQPLN